MFGGLKSGPRLLCVDAYDRKVQKKKTSGFFVAVPSPIAHALGIEKGRTVRFWAVNGKAVFKPISSDGLTKKDVADIDRYEDAVREIREELKAGAVGSGPAGPGGGAAGDTGSAPAAAGREPAGQGAGQINGAPAGRGSADRSGPRSNSERLQRLRL